jgi:uncharacterized membrane protein YkoI
MCPGEGRAVVSPESMVEENTMRKFVCWSAAVTVAGFLVLGAAAWADEEKVSLDKLPKAVVTALKDRFPNAELKSAEKETADGKTVYDVSLKHKGDNYEVAVSPEGVITGYEKEIPAKDLPKAVSKTLESKYPKATIKMVEEVYKVKDKKDELEYYEVALVTADKKKMEVNVAPDGKIINAKEE